MAENPTKFSPVETYGWTAVPRDLETLLKSGKHVGEAKPMKVEEMKTPQSGLVKKVMEYVKKELPEETFNHSMRVYYYGLAILNHSFPHFPPSIYETYLLTSLLHDIGTTDKNLHATLLSFEFYGGFLSLNLLKDEFGAPKEQAESVCEAVIRHQDLGTTGKISMLGGLIQLATIFDNMGEHPELVHKSTIEDVVSHFPRKGWSSCFSATIRRENGLKPWAHTTHLGEEVFPNGVKGNKLMEPYD